MGTGLLLEFRFPSSNSEVGLACLSIAAFFLRLVCTNGMISKTEVSASYRHISLKILGEFPKVMERVSFELSQQKSQFKISMQTPVEIPLMTLKASIGSSRLERRKGKRSNGGWEQEMGENHVAYDQCLYPSGSV